MASTRNFFKDVLFGVATGDALGVPYEFLSRSQVAAKPTIDMISYGTHGQPPGTWSDDASLTFCLAEALTKGLDLQEIGNNFVAWRYKNFWTAHGEVFDIGITTQRAIDRLANGTRPDLAGDFEASSNGNGSLMRILPLLFYIKDLPVDERFGIIRNVSSLTHGHVRSVIACFFYLEFARNLLRGGHLHLVYQKTCDGVSDYMRQTPINKDEVALFDRLLSGQIHQLPAGEIQSSGYVLFTLEASIWCLLTTANYKEAVIKAVSLGEDTDTTAAVTGGLAGLVYGMESIPEHWLLMLARNKDIADLADRIKHKFE